MNDSISQRSFTAQQRKQLQRLLRAAYPHPSLPDAPYERTADAVITKAQQSTFEGLSLAAGLDSLDQRVGGDFTALTDEAALTLLRQIADAPFFKAIRAVAVASLYNDHQTWEVLGYEGASFDKGGYLTRGFNDLDWLPKARVEEYTGPEPLIEVAEQDQPKGAVA